ncbi:hypothetical protein LshimejAT787_0403080 [Lyophyllum shimeji]|uniref:Uncharacterized protein n=1 Tax=Lyophyllum shimeji TaxID=47721 RepID=A0A9P3ULD0_LYOSH|nr:hypothetical protein LshimejAT787_0403080 [Lyophyllum shimeji]
MSLAAICSVMVGDEMECHAQVEEPDEEPTNVLDDLYSTIPFEYRRWAVLSHALSLILNSTAHHPTLLMALLELTLDHRLHHESCTLLRSLLSLALRPTSPANVPPICHPTHSNLLFDLCTRWNAGGFSDASLFKVFVQTLVDVQCPDAFVCKATHRLAQVMCSRDFSSFIWLISIIADLDVNSGRKTRLRDESKSGEERLQSRQHTWLKMAFEQLTFTNMPRGSQEAAEYTDAMGEMLLSAFAPGHPHRRSPDAEGLLLCLATCWLVSQSHHRLPSTYLIQNLATVQPQACTFSALIEKVLSESAGRLHTIQETMESLAATLRAAGLLHLEVSLWECALRHIELPTHERTLAASNSIADIQSYRRRLIGLVDDAEDRCYGRPVINSPRSGLSSGAWEWEPFVGCWIPKTEAPASVRKKRRLEHPRLSSRTIRPSRRPSLVITPETPATRVSCGRSLECSPVENGDDLLCLQDTRDSYCNER